MPLFICESCGCMDLTSWGTYYEKELGWERKAECCVCSGRREEWHNTFERREWDEKKLVLNPPVGKVCWNCKVGPVEKGERCPRCSKTQR